MLSEDHQTETQLSQIDHNDGFRRALYHKNTSKIQQYCAFGQAWLPSPLIGIPPLLVSRTQMAWYHSTTIIRLLTSVAATSVAALGGCAR
jgi:hypothetical protein